MSLTGKDLVLVAKKHPIGVGCALLSIVLLAFAYLRSSKLEEAQLRLDEVSAMGGRLDRNIAYSAQLDVQLNELNEALEVVKARTLNAGALAQNLQYFYKLESESGVKLTELRQLNAVPAPGKGPVFASLPFSVGVEGEFSNVMTFLRKLENGEFYGRVLSSSFRPSSGEGRVIMTISAELLARP